MPGGADHRGGRRQSRYRQTAEGPGLGVMEIALPYRGNAFRVVYAVQIGPESTHGIKTPKHEIDLVATRVKRLKEMLR